MAKASNTVPAAPMAEWLQGRFEGHKRPPSGFLSEQARSLDAARKLSRELGWGMGEAGVRKLYRYRHQLMCGSRHGRLAERTAVEFPRDTVEDALHYVGGTALFYDVYERYANERAGRRASARDVLAFLAPFEGWVAIAEELEERDRELEEEQWCPECCEDVTPYQGMCLWHEPPVVLVDGFHLELGMAA